MKILEVRFGTADVAAAEVFYGRVLGLPVHRASNRLVVRAGTTDLVLTGSVVSPGAQHLAFTIPRNLFDSAKTWLKERVDLLQAADGDEFECAPFWNARSIYFEGPDHNVLELIIRRDLTNDVEAPFDAKSILNVSEVGVPVANVLRFQHATEDLLGFEAYGQGGATFRPIGDVDGLLIAVEQERTWFPTAHPAVEQPLEIILKTGAASQISPNGSCTITTL